jgi:hypothetical protein
LTKVVTPIGLSYYIFYGFMSGLRQSKDLRALLHASGYTQAQTAQEADIIIAHSAGCWMVSDDLQPKLTLYVGMPLQPGNARKIIRKAKNRNKQDVLESSVNGPRIQRLHRFYLFTQPRRNIKIITKAKHFMRLPDFVQGKTVFVINKNDPWPDSKKLLFAIENLPFTFVCLEGSHTPIWHQPKQYVALINQYAAELLA